MVVSASTDQVWTKITIGSYAHVFYHSESDTSSVSMLTRFVKLPISNQEPYIDSVEIPHLKFGI